jgi:hypothetical protein
MPDKPYHCRACNVSFGTQRELDEHNKKAHPGTSPKERKEADM